MTPLFTYGTAFTGIGGFDLGMDRAGGTCLWQIEKNTHARSVLRRHWPLATKIHDIHDAHRLAPVTVFLFGSPCQNLSVAGERAGLAGSESGLFFEGWRLSRELGARFVVFENVFGLLSSNEGRDFATVVGAFTGSIPEVPRDGWGNAGFMRSGGEGCYHVAWRVLDAKHFGVPQRRRRVFLVASLGDGGCAEVLFEPEAMQWHPGPREEAQEDLAGTLGSSSASGGRRTTAIDGIGAYVVGQDGVACAALSGTLCHQGKAAGSTTQQAAESGQLVAERVFDPFNMSLANNGAAPTVTTGAAHGHGSLVATYHVGFNDAGGKRRDRPEGGAYIFPTDIAPCVTTNGDSPIVIVAFDENQITHRENRSASQPGDPCPTLSATGHPAAVAYRTAGDGCAYTEGDQTAPLTTGTDQSAHLLVYGDGWTVRRLTPIEYEKLQGFSPDHTAWGINDEHDRVEIKDGPRYAMVGNAVAAVCGTWIGSRIARLLRREAGLP